MAETISSSYTAPPWDAPEDRKLGWLREASEEGENYLKSQRGYADIDKSIDIISGLGEERIPKGQSRVHVNMIKRDLREIVATLSNMRPIWGYKTDNEDLQHHAEVLNKLQIAWYHNTFADREIRKALQYAGGCGMGWVSPIWEKDEWVAGRGDIRLKTYGPRQVLPVQIGEDHNIQDAYAVTIKVEVGFAKAAAMFPTQLDKLAPDRNMPTWMAKGIRRVQRFMSPALDRFGPGRGKESSQVIFPTVDINNTYIMDLSCNMTDRPIMMGQPGTPWYYVVPPYGSDIPAGVHDPKTGQMLTRKANFEDSRLFPLKRLCQWTDQGTLYDGTSTWWHGKYPLVPFAFDDWPWDFLGLAMARDTSSIQESNTRLLRAVDDSANARLDPALAFDEGLMSRSAMDRINPRVGGQRIALNMQMGDAVKPLIPADYYNVPSWILAHIESMYERLHHLHGTRDIQALAKARQIPAGDSAEKIMEMAGALITDMSRNMERSMRGLGEMVKSLFLEFYDSRRKIQILGRDGVTEEEFDFEPGLMVPSHLPDEQALIKAEMKTLADRGVKSYSPPPSRASMIERARVHQDSFYFHIVPNSMHQITQLTRKLLYMQLWKGQFPIDPWTMAEVLDIPNFGNASALSKILGAEIPSDVLGRWIAWKEVLMKLQGEAQPKGRKPSGQTAPTMQQKDGGARTTVRESPR